MKLELICANCGKHFYRYKSTLRENKKHYCCSKMCQYAHQSVTNTGANNGNFGNKWSEEQKENYKKSKKESIAIMGPESRKEKFGKSNRGLTRSPEFIENWHRSLRSPDYIRPPISEEQRSEIGKKSAAKFTPEFKKQYRQTMESAGWWIPRNEENAFHYYQKQSHWIYRMWDKVTLPDNFDEVGIFNCRTNQKGYIRDHRVSKMSGFTAGLFPEILRHPANCDIITHSENARKRSHNSTSIEDLLRTIENYTGEWEEQQLCSDLISLYRQNITWNIHYE